MTYDYYSGRIYPDEFNTEKGLRDLGNAMDNLGTVVGLSPNEKAKLNYWAHSLPFVGSMLNAKDDWNYMNDYLSNRDMQWSDVKYRGMSQNVAGASYGIATTGYHFISDNVKHLYDEDNHKPKAYKVRVRKGHYSPERLMEMQMGMY